MGSLILPFLGLVAIFVFTIISFLRKSQQLRQAQITREQAVLDAIKREKKGQTPP